MVKNNLRAFGLLLGVVMLGSCARGVVAPPGLNSRLLDIKVKDTDSATVITLKTNNLPQYAAFKTKSPPTVTIDLASTDSSPVSGGISVDNGFIGKVSVEQLGESTGYSSRITIHLEKPLSYTTSADGNDIVVSVSKTEEQPAAGSSLEGEGLSGTSSLQSGLELSPSAGPEALAPLGMEQSPSTTSLEAVPLAGIGETSPAPAPEALAPLGMEQSPSTTSLEAVPLAGIGETSSAPAPEALAPSGMGQGPAVVPPPEVPLSAGISPTTPSAPGQSESMESLQPAEVTAPPPAPEAAPEAPAATSAPEAVTSPPAEVAAPAVTAPPPAPAEKKHKKEQKIAMVVPAAPVTPSIRGVRIVRGVLVAPVPLIFKSNEAVLNKNAEEGLKHVADYMNEHSHLKLLIQGYTDGYGRESYNKELSYYRTLWVKMALERYGVSSNRLMIKPMGSTKKFGHTKAAEARNRRVVLSVVK